MLRILLLSARLCDIPQDGQANVKGVSVYYIVPNSNPGDNPDFIGEVPGKDFLPTSEWEKIKAHGVMSVYDCRFSTKSKNGANVLKLTQVTPVKG